jgi:tripartite-type tricarboxylate transporter receptor subunit TctC
MTRLLCVLGTFGLLAGASAQAQDYPTRQVRIIVPQSPGGVTDVVARAVAQRLAELWGQPVVVENRAGANYQIGATAVARAEPDGYTLMVMSEGFSISPLLTVKLPFDPVKDFAPITGLISLTHAVTAHPALPANSIPELIALARAKPGDINYGTYGVGSAGHLNMEMFQGAAGVRVTPVHYKGATPALTDVIAGHIPLMFISVASVVGPQKAGQVKILAVGSGKRLPALPDIPTIAEGGLPDFRAVTWFGMFATGGTPREIVAKINTDVHRVFADAAFQERFLKPQLFEPLLGSPQEFADFLKAETAKWGKVIRDAHLKAD